MTSKGRAGGSLMAVALGVGAAALCPSFADAQAPGFSSNASAGLGVAPPRDQKRLTIDLLGKVEYNSNVAQGRDVISTIRRLDKEDILYQPSARVTYNMPVGRNSVYATVDAGYDFYQNNHNLEAPRVSGAAGGLANFGACNASGNVGYTFSQSDVSTLPLLVTKNRVTTRHISGQVACSVGPGITGFVGGTLSDVDNSSNFRLVDSSSRMVNAGIGYQNSVIGSIQLIGTYSKNDYKHSSLTGAPEDLLTGSPDYEASSIGLQYSRPIGARLKGAVSLSYQEIKSDSPLSHDSSTLSGSGQLDYQVNPRLGLTFAYQRSAQPTIIQGYDYVLDEGYNFHGRYKLSSRLNAHFEASWMQTKYEGTGPILIGVPTEQKTRHLGAGLDMNFARQTSLGVYVRQEHENSEPNVFDYTAYMVGVTARKSF